MYLKFNIFRRKKKIFKKKNCGINREKIWNFFHFEMSNEALAVILAQNY